MPLELEQWVPIPGFPGYEVSNFGRIYSSYIDRTMAFTLNSIGIPTVGLVRDQKQYRRSVKVLVARAFVLGETGIFNTPIQLDGDRWNLRADNMVWRPRWFAHRYTSQFLRPHEWYNVGPIFEIINNVRYECIGEAAVTNGHLCIDIRRSLLYGFPVFPNRVVYTKVYEKHGM